MTTGTASTRPERLYARLLSDLGDRVGPGWRTALLAAPRHLFIPDQAARVDNTTGATRPIDRASDSGGWLAGVYSPDAIVTHYDPHGVAVSACSMPYMVAGMLAHLDAQPGMRVLEIGTGTGWNAAILSARLGDNQVVTVEIDPGIADQARINLHRAGRTPAVVTGDGAAGWPPGAPYDRVIATCAVHRVPYPWVAQTRPGGVVLTPWGTPLDNGALLRLTVAPDGSACGRFVDSAVFMWLRSQTFRAPDEPDEFDALADTRTATIDVGEVFADAAIFATGLRVPDCKVAYDHTDTGHVQTYWLLAADSWASATPTTGQVRQLGNRRLWDETETAHTWWQQAGRPEPDRFGVTVTPNGQMIWLDSPDQQVTATSPGAAR